MLHAVQIQATVDEDDAQKEVEYENAQTTIHLYSTPPDEVEVCKYYEVWGVPCESLEGVWETLWFRETVKSQLLRYVSARDYLCKRGIHSSGLIILHGRPGTGKTTVCKGLAQKMGVRRGVGKMVYVKLDCVLSKWFSESANNISEIFTSVGGMTEPTLVVLDEVESICLSRDKSLGLENSDSIRAVNALLKGVDSIREKGNITVICTSNLVMSIDEAFLDRADMVLYIDVMGGGERRLLLEGLFSRLIQQHIVVGKGELQDVIQACEGLSGRRICGLPVVALSLLGNREQIPFQVFVQAFIQAAKLAKSFNRSTQ